ncbi:MAG TPA: AsmA family protein [Roseiarcus sp.]|nr:AsmA family protein [Roseiarcus sp.]
MRPRLKWAALVFAAALAAAAGAYRWPLASAHVRAEFGRQLADAVGLELRGPARAYLTLLPLPAIQLVDVELSGADGATLIVAPQVKARIALGPLLAGRLRLSSAILRRPTVLVDLDRPPFAKSSALARLIASKNPSAGETPFGAFRVERGLVHLVSAENGLDTLIEDASGELDWPRLADPARLDLHARWRGAPVTIAARLDAPAQWLTQQGSPAFLDITSPIGALKLAGALKPGEKNGFEGSVSADFASTAALARLFGARPTSFPPDGRLAFAGKIAFGRHILTLSDMRLEALAQSADGALALTRNPSGWTLSGSLAAGALSLDEVLANMPAIYDESGWSDAPLSAGNFGALALDLRASIAKLQWRNHVLQDAALSLMSRDGRVTATLSEATAYKGLLKGEASFAPDERGIEMRATASLANADIGAMLADFGASGYSGQGGGQFSVQAAGDSPAALARALSGDASIALGPGAIEGLSFEEALRRSERRPINLFADMRTGRTVFNEAAAKATIEKGEAHIRSAAMIGPGVLITLNGAADLAARQLAAQITAARADEHGAPKPGGPEIHVTITGPWARPLIKSDTGA